MFRPALLALMLALSIPAGAPAQSWGREETAPDGVAEIGLPFPVLARIARQAAGGGTPIGSDYDPRSRVYRFKFIREGRVTWVDIDATSAQVLRVEGR